MENLYKNLIQALKINFVKEDRYMYIVNGLANTLVITLFATIIGIVLGLFISIIRVTHDKIGKTNSFLINAIINFLDFICKLYIGIIRGTPVVVQLMILFFCIFVSPDISGIFIAIIGFGLNSAAYVSEIFRAGLMSIDIGQTEAGRSLGLSYVQTMIYIIVPQAFKVVLPSLCNEFIVLIKETSVAGYVAVQDLTRGGDYIRSRTYDAWTPLLMVALIYFALTSIFSYFAKKLENNLRKNERG